MSKEEELVEQQQPLTYAQCHNLLLETRERVIGQLNRLETLQRKLAAARKNPTVRIYCWEDEEGYTMSTVTKPTMGFIGMREPILNPLPEGVEPVEVDTYEQQLEDAVCYFQRELGDTEEKLGRLEEIPGGKGIRCFKIGKKIEIRVNDRGPVGFVVQ